MEKYDLHKNDFSKLHFELKHLAPYYLKNKEKASKPHRHSFFQILLFKNKGNHYIDYEIIKHPANTLILINKNQVHHFCKESSNDGFLFHFNDSFIANFSLEVLSRFMVSIFNEIGDSYIHLSNKESLVIQGFSESIISEISESKDNYTEIVLHQFLALLYFIERISKKQNRFVTDTYSDFSIIVKFKQLIVEHIDQTLSVQEFADKLKISTKKLTLITKQHTSLTPGGLIKELKILEAKRMLSNQNISIKEIAYSLGFDQPTYFTKFFKQVTQVTPKQFQEQVL